MGYNPHMKQTIALKLETTPQQFDALLETMQAFNAGCDYVAAVAFEHNSANKIALQPFVYGELRSRFKLSSQMAVRCIGKACEAFKSARSLHREQIKTITAKNNKRAEKGLEPLALPVFKGCIFDPHGAMVYDERLMNVKDAAHVSLLTLQGRILVGMRYGEYQAARLAMQKGQADLILRDDVYYLYICIDLPTPPPVETEGYLGVDLGIVEIASDSIGNQYSGDAVKRVRKNVAEHRRQLQSKQANSAKKRLRKVSRRQSRFVRNVNHVISKKLVATAAHLQKALALENLEGIRERAGTVSKQMRWLLGNWAFDQLGQFVCYKAEMAGLSVVLVDPSNTSRTCSCCGYCDRANRKSQGSFRCLQCGFGLNADLNAARNIEARASQSERLLSFAAWQR
jgi:putative transposase